MDRLTKPMQPPGFKPPFGKRLYKNFVQNDLDHLCFLRFLNLEIRSCRLFFDWQSKHCDRELEA